MGLAKARCSQHVTISTVLYQSPSFHIVCIRCNCVYLVLNSLCLELRVRCKGFKDRPQQQHPEYGTSTVFTVFYNRGYQKLCLIF